MPKTDSVGHAVEMTPEKPETGQKPERVSAEREPGSNSAPPTVQAPPSADAGARTGWAVATCRWRQEGRDEEVATFRDRARKEYERTNPGRRRRDAHEYAWKAAIAAFPPEGEEPEALILPEQPGKEEPPTRGDSGQIQGLSSIPIEWLELPANAGLKSEIGWVQANRLYIVEDKPSGATVVDLSQALEPAPSRAALGWLETSIRAYAKYVDIVARSLATQADEQQRVRRERMAIDEIRSLLDEMHRD